MTTTTFPQPILNLDGVTGRRVEPLARDQQFALQRLQCLLERRDAVDAGRLSRPDDEPWLVRALDAAIVSYYRLAREFGLQADAEAALWRYRRFGLGSLA